MNAAGNFPSLEKATFGKLLIASFKQRMLGFEAGSLHVKFLQRNIKRF